MGDSRVQVDGKSSSMLTPGFKPEESTFLKQLYQDRVEEETTSPTAEKKLSTSGQTTPTPPPSDPLPLSHSFGQMTVFPIQAKLKIGQPNDKYEQEADRVAEQVMQMPEPGSPAAAITRLVRAPRVQRMCSDCDEELQRQPLEEGEDEEKMMQAKPIAGLTTPVIQRQGVESEEEEEDKLHMKPLASQFTPLIQRKAESSEEEDEEIVQTKPVSHSFGRVSVLPVQRQAEEEEEKVLQTKPLVERISPLIQRMVEPTEEDEEKLQTVQTKENPGQAPSVTSNLEARLNTSKGSGQPLPDETRSFMESRFGHDFSQVRVHAGGAAGQLNQELRAQAFTHGQDVYFGAGKYSPKSLEGKRLLAHELTHTVQQSSVIRRRIQRQCDRIAPEFRSVLGGNVPANREERRSQVQGLSDEQKSNLRELIRSCAEQEKTRIISSRSPNLSPRARSFRRQVQNLCDQGVRKIRNYRRRNRQQATERVTELNIREEDLQIYKEALKDDLTTWFDYEMNKRDLSSKYRKVRELGNPEIQVNENDLQNIRYSIFLGRIAINQGGEAFVLRKIEDILYSQLKINRADLRTQSLENQEEPEESEARSRASSESLDPNELSELSEFYQQVEESGAPVDTSDQARALELVREMSSEERREFIEFYQAVATSTDEPTTLAKALERYQGMTELQRETLRTNRELSQETEEDATPPISDSNNIRLNLSRDRIESKVQTVQQVNDILAQIRSRLGSSDNSGDRSISDALSDALSEAFGEEAYLFYYEMAILDGLLVGASERAPQFAPVANDLKREIDNFDRFISNQMREMLIELVFLQGVSYATKGVGFIFTGARIATLLRRLNKLRELFVKVREILGVIQSIQSALDGIQRAGEAYNTFKQRFEPGLSRYRALQSRLNDLDSSEDLDEEVAQLREELLEQIQTQLDGSLGELLENFYITEEDAEDEEKLMAIFLNIPAGVEELERVIDRYKQASGSENSSETAGILAVMSVNAGAKLYPLVGFLATVAKEELSEMNRQPTASETFENGMDRILSGGGKRGRGRNRRSSEARGRRREENRGFFNRLRPRRYWYPPSVFDEPISWMRTEFGKLDSDSNISFNGFWTRRWFRRKARSLVRELNRHRNRFGRVRGAKEGRRSGPLVPGGAPYPRFRLKWPRSLNRQGRLSFKLRINPVSREEIFEQRLSYTSFRSPGVKLNTGDRDRTKALVSWLEDRNYHLQEFGSRRFIRHMSRGRGPGRGRARQFLQIKSGMVIQDSNLSETKAAIDGGAFIGNSVTDDQDLPEGYVLSSQGVRRRAGQRWNLRQYLLGLDDNNILERVERERSFPITQTRTQILGYEDRPVINPEGMIDEMFEADSDNPKPEYNTQRRNRTQWQRLIRNQPHLRRRPIRIHAILGNVRYARAFGDRLSSRHLPELKHGDDKGHIIAKRFGGSDSYQNLIPMNRELNRYVRRGTWAFQEQGSANLFIRGTQKVEVKIRIMYPSNNNGTRRPQRFSIRKQILTYNSDSKKWEPFGSEIGLRRRLTQ